MAKSKLKVHVVLDKSQSMQSIRGEAISGFNEYVAELAKNSPDAKLSLTVFSSSGINTIISNRLVTEVPPLTLETFVPSGMTPLYDAIGKVVSDFSNARGTNKALVILTDGQENASQEYTAASVKRLLEEKQKEEKWLVLYLGANQDAFAEGNKFGTVAGNTMTYDVDNMKDTFLSASAATLRYASGGLMSASFTAEERARAVGKKKDNITG